MDFKAEYKNKLRTAEEAVKAAILDYLKKKGIDPIAYGIDPNEQCQGSCPSCGGSCGV